ncbi:MAG: nucleotide sugar dehydrogenase [Chloroflexi bacterium]|nr:nucleotide sugar dehydrogenase [Chloroflexota bacterium]
MDLIDRIADRKARIAVVGIGYVGLPLAVSFAEAGFEVVGIDSDRTRADAVNRGESYVEDVDSSRLAALTKVVANARGGRSRSTTGGRPAGSLSASNGYDSLSSADVVIVCVPTPLSKTKVPDLSYIIAASDEIAAHLRPGVLVVLESTTYPGTTEELVLPRLAGSNGRSLIVGRDFFLAFSPERIDPGNRTYSIRNTPKVVGGVTASCLEVAKSLYGTIVEQVVPVSSTRAAEMVKLLENTFRATNIALVNEMAIMCRRLDLDVWEVIEAAKTKPYGFMPFYPGPGLGGHCIPIDPQYLAWKLKSMNYQARFIQLAEEINFDMPHYVSERISDALNADQKSVKGSHVLILGAAYKADVADVRESPAVELIEILDKKGASVSYNDPLVPSLNSSGITLESVPLTEAVLADADCVVIATAHRAYDWQYVADHSRLIVDTRNATARIHEARARIVKL